MRIILPPDKFPSRGLSVPTGRVSRLARFVGLASNVAGGMMLDGARQLAEGKRPSLNDLLLTPANAFKVMHQLAHLRGAAMKVGQLLSMDAGELLPRELADILGRLRSEARRMPQAQLRATLDRQWGRGWEQRFEQFSYQPIAAASIGQVHRARTRDGRELAIKIQYPGIRGSIDSDVDNVSSLLRMSGLLPAAMDIAPILKQAKLQLHEEADYQREGRNLRRFGELLADSPDYLLPGLHDDLTGRDVLAMSYVEGASLESMEAAPQAERDRIATLLIELVLRELFEFRLMQTDPNFANYRYNVATRRLVLLDFGAVREFSPEITQDYRDLLRAGIAGDRPAATRAALDVGLFKRHLPAAQQDAVMALFDMAMQPLRQDGAFDFGQSDIAARLRDGGMRIATDREHWSIPPIETLLLQRKVGGIFLLASRLRARVHIRPLLANYL
ncbi:AarF/ABC1/UbiB kinase family protein [Tardiphaga sp.]|uniref:ABC1 kinase family protein n=1 Tax=Tardiphaga sp. TaxID=1926292 RepID=UPI0025F5660C|nr:AarF/ABC1/UbiB kinase family protein [Tardiphaga sp.]